MPLRTALIGLSSSATTSWASGAHLPGLLTPQGRSVLPIKALLNSSVDAAKRAIGVYNLSPDTKAYGSPEDLANDPDIDLVICNTRVDAHFQTILPSIKKGKDVYVEWPVAGNMKDIDVLVEEAEKSGSRVAVGIQRRWAPQALKLRELLKGGNGKLGKVLSSDVRAFGGTNDREIIPTGLKYFAERDVGGNLITISNAHLLDTILSVLGELSPSTTHTALQLQRPNVRVRDPATKNIVGTVRSNVPDLLSLHGTIASSSATLTYLFRRGQPFPGTPVLVWTINCEFGEIRLVSPSTLSFGASPNDEPITIHIHWFENDKVEEIEWQWGEAEQQLPIPARTVFRSLMAFGEGKDSSEGWVDIKDAQKRAHQIEGWLQEWEKTRV
ncbi:unnamed protein product [Periconia digitata]|uniref:Oxidoreductase n=1 Tax=Periconia digitata TaxID=1303443 RepID=A0A9W4UE26_9PLEO|nr:unnamed protein product [Periconia digitata]